MPVVPSLAASVRADRPYYRITPISYRTPRKALHNKVVNGDGAVRSRRGARYNFPGACTVYLAEDVHTCLCERMFYLHREILAQIDNAHLTGFLPSFEQHFVLWEIKLSRDVADVFELSIANANAISAFPTLMLSPSQDYHHLKDRRAAIQHQGYKGLRAPSSRAPGAERLVVLFEDQSKNVHSIVPFDVQFRLVTDGASSAPFSNLASDLLDFAAGEVKILASASTARLPAPLRAYRDWRRVEFRR